MALAGARSIGNTIRTDNHMVRARECWKAMWAARDGAEEPKPSNPTPAPGGMELADGSQAVTVTVYAHGDNENTPAEAVHHALAYAHKAGFIDCWDEPRAAAAQSAVRARTIEEGADAACRALSEHGRLSFVQVHGWTGLIEKVDESIRALAQTGVKR